MTAPPDSGSESTQSAADAEPALAAGETTTFVFTNAVFKAPGARFVGYGNDRTPMFAVDLGDSQGLVAIPAMKRQFNIAHDTPDDRMVNLAVRSLKFVAEIRPGDNIPNEILTGRASWMIDPRHTEIARRKLELQLLVSAGVDKKEVSLTDTRAISVFLEQPENKAKLREAFRAAARAMGKAEGDHAHVLERLTIFAREVAYIEALREWFLQVGAINKKLQFVRKAYDGDRRFVGEVSQMTSLLMTANREYRQILTRVDELCSDVIGALTELEPKMSAVRDGRDQLHQLTLIWKDIVAQWRNCNRDNAVRYLSTAQETYRFLASRHSSGRSMLKS